MTQRLFITGGSSGLGLRLTVDALHEGSDVVATYCQHPKSLYYLGKRFHRLVAMHLDLLDPKMSCLPTTALDAVILFAGTIRSRLIISETQTDWSRMIQANLTSNRMILQTLYPALCCSSSAHVIIISSLSALRGNVGQVAYSASKSAMVGFAKSLAQEWASDNIKVNVVLPGFMKSRQTMDLSNEVVSTYQRDNVLQRGNTLKELSAFIRFLTTTQNISGQVFCLDSRINNRF